MRMCNTSYNRVASSKPEYSEGDQFSHPLRRKNTAFTGAVVDGTYL